MKGPERKGYLSRRVRRNIMGEEELVNVLTSPLAIRQIECDKSGFKWKFKSLYMMGKGFAGWYRRKWLDLLNIFRYRVNTGRVVSTRETYFTLSERGRLVPIPKRDVELAVAKEVVLDITLTQYPDGSNYE